MSLYFLDTPALIAASRKPDQGMSQFIESAKDNGIELISANYCFAEAKKNLPHPHQKENLESLKKLVRSVPTKVVEKRFLPNITSKDRPVLISALHEKADCLVTSDGPFRQVTGPNVYGMLVKDAKEAIENHAEIQKWIHEKRQEEARLAEAQKNSVQSQTQKNQIKFGM